MEPIRSGTTTERIVRTTILTLILLLFSVWHFYDGYVGYPKQNREWLVKNLLERPDPLPEVNHEVTKESVESVERGDSPEEVVAKLGQPALKEGGTWYFFGAGGLGKVRVEDVALGEPAWTDAEHSALDLAWQKGVGVVTGVLGLLMVLQWIRVVTTRIELTEAGFRVNSQGGMAWGGSPLIPFEAMKGLRDPGDRFRNKKSDWVELDYELADGTTGCVRLNIYVHKAFREVKAVICKRRGFEDPEGAYEPDESAAEQEGGEPSAAEEDR